MRWQVMRQTSPAVWPILLAWIDRLCWPCAPELNLTHGADTSNVYAVTMKILPTLSLACRKSTLLRFSLFRSLVPLVFIGTSLVLVPRARAQGSYVNFEGKQTSPVRLSPDGTRLFAVNTPDGRVSVFDVSQPSNPRLLAEIPVGIEPVSVQPVNNDEAWVVNEVSDSISVISVSRR